MVAALHFFPFVEIRKKVQTVSFNHYDITQSRMSWHLILFLFGQHEWGNEMEVNFDYVYTKIEYNVLLIMMEMVGICVCVWVWAT